MSAWTRRASLLAVAAATLPAVAIAAHPDDDHGGAAGPAQVAIRATAVHPAAITVLAGERVEWHNVSVREHTITSRDGLFHSDRIGSNRTFGHAFSAVGSFGYYCRIHPYITGRVDVASVLLHAPAGPLVSGDQLVLDGRAGSAGGPVTIERDLGAGFVPLVTVERAADRTFSAGFAVDATAAYRAVAGADVSPPVHVEVVRARTLTVSTARGRRRPLVRIAVSPALPGGTVHVQRYIKERFGWWTVRRARLAGGRRATVGLRRAAKGTVRVVLTQPDGETSAAVSRIVRLPRHSRRE